MKDGRADSAKVVRIWWRTQERCGSGVLLVWPTKRVVREACVWSTPALSQWSRRNRSQPEGNLWSLLRGTRLPLRLAVSERTLWQMVCRYRLVTF